MRDPTYYCVQTFWKDGESLSRVALTHYRTARAAAGAAKDIRAPIIGAVAFEVQARPEFEIWGEPRLLAIHGDVPAVSFG